ncbi:MAG: MmgE/PrpD family protein [Chloroflexi bacterium]|nr:MmgE/PrpD family protein [Chloroflexota bacterium]
MDQRIEKMISYAHGLTYEDLPDEVVVRAKELVLDTIGCALGAAQSPPAGIVRSVASRVTSSTPATVMISGTRTTPDMATFANGVMARYLDWNDGYFGLHGGGHPSDMLAPTLAAVEAVRGGGKEVILGLALGYEIQCGLADAGGMDVKIGGNQTLDGGMGAVVLGSRILGLNREQMAHAINLAIAACRPLGQQSRGQLSHWKEAHVANASRNGIFCAMMAAEGLTGPEFDFAEPTQLLPFGGEGRGFRIMEAGIKHFPAGYFSQSAIETMQELRPQVRRLEDIKAIRLQTFPNGFNAMGSDPSRWRPTNHETADHSLPFVMAVALMEGDLTTRHYDQEYYLRPDVRAVMDKITIRVGEECVQAWPDQSLNIVEVELQSGEVLGAQVGLPLGHHKHPMTDANLEHKFRPMAEEYGKLPSSQVDRLLNRIRHLEEVQDISEVLRLTVGPSN